MLMHRFGWIYFVFSFFDRKDERNTEQEQDSEVQKDIHIGQYGALEHYFHFEYFIGFGQGFVGGISF